MICWELPTHLQTFDDSRGPEPSSVSRFFTLSLSEKANLRHVLESWRGRSFSADDLENGFDVSNLLGVSCLLQVLHKRTNSGEVKAVVGSVSKLPKGLACPNQRNPSRLFTFDESSQEDLQALPSWQCDIIAQAAEYPAWSRRFNGDQDATDERMISQQPLDGEYDDIPF